MGNEHPFASLKLVYRRAHGARHGPGKTCKPQGERTAENQCDQCNAGHVLNEARSIPWLPWNSFWLAASIHDITSLKSLNRCACLNLDLCDVFLLLGHVDWVVLSLWLNMLFSWVDLWRGSAEPQTVQPPDRSLFSTPYLYMHYIIITHTHVYTCNVYIILSLSLHVYIYVYVYLCVVVWSKHV